MLRRTALWCAAAGLAAVGAGAAVVVGPRDDRPRDAGWRDDGWREVAWPFPQDAWPAGRAFRCRSASCGGEMEVYLRPKLGFCANCALGVTEDAEVDGVADLDMISGDFVPAGSGEQVAAGGLAGRMRSYTVRFADGTRRPSSGFALSRPAQCDLFVAASLGTAAGTQAGRGGVLGLIGSAPVAAWIRQRLGG